MKRAYVIGSPIRHSISPAIHNAAFAHLAIDARYEAVEVLPEGLGDWIRLVRGQDLLGCSVTIPHKEAIMPFLDEIGGDAILAGAVNTVVARPPFPSSSPVEGEGTRPPPPSRGRVGERGLVGLNTDTLGFRRSLADEAGVSLRGKRVVLLGAGGAARAVAMVALQDGAESLVVANRHVERAGQLLAALSAIGSDTAAMAVDLPGQDLARDLTNANVIVNATSVGLASQDLPIDPSLITPGSLVMDLIYNPRETALLRAARLRGAETLGGLGMLVFQAAAAFEAWTGVEAPVDVMRKAAEEALAGREAPGATPLFDPPPQGGRE